MHRVRRVMMIAVVAAALSADRVGASAPSSRPHIADVARRLADRLVRSLSRHVSAGVIRHIRCEFEPGRPGVVRPAAQAIVHCAQAQPFQFRLPPPLA